MRARRRHRWVAWLLPLLVLRAFVPAGFMLSWAGGDLQIVLCSGSGPATPSVAQYVAENGAHHQHHHHDDAESKVHENSLCPFAAAGPASTAQPEWVSILVYLCGETRFDSPTESTLRSALVSVHRIRGPPLS